MKEFNYTIKAEQGLHARPAGIMAQKAMGFKSEITIKSNGKEASAKKLFAVMKLGVKQNDSISVVFEGEDEEEAYKVITALIGENF